MPSPPDSPPLALEPGQRKFKSNDISQELSKKWKAMDEDTKAQVTDPLVDELVVLRADADTKAKVIPAHAFNDVASTMRKIAIEVCCQE